MEMTMHEHELAPTTHTVELRQVKELNAALATGRRRITAGSIGVHAHVGAGAPLRFLESEGPPSYPYVYGIFASAGPRGVTRIELHTANLRAISSQLSLRSHIWG
jgi:hypothetical protein